MKKRTAQQQFLHDVIERAGGPVRVGRAFDPQITGQAVSKWVTSEQIPADRVLRICELTRGDYTPHQLRPDVFRKDMK